MQEKRNHQPATNFQMMTVEPRDDPSCIGIVMRSRDATRNDNSGKKEAKATWIRKTIEKSLASDIEKEKQEFMDTR